MNRLILFCLLIGVFTGTALAQLSGDATIEQAEPYDPEEFSQFARDLRRAEIIAIGSVPVTLLASRLMYGVGRFTVQSIVNGRIATEYLPPALAPPGFVPLSRADNAWILAGTALLSTTVALIDYFLGRREMELSGPSGDG